MWVRCRLARWLGRGMLVLIPNILVVAQLENAPTRCWTLKNICQKSESGLRSVSDYFFYLSYSPWVQGNLYSVACWLEKN